MGTRIHKVMGWGIDTIEVEDFNITDSRINTDFFKSEEYWKREGDIKGFFQWMEDSREECEQIVRVVEPNRWTGGEREKDFHHDVGITLAFWKREQKEGKKRYNCHAVTHDAECGMGEVLLFSPIDSPDFYRCDDTIDYYESGCQIDNHVRCLTKHCGIYPYQGIIHIPDSPKWGEESYPHFVEPGDYNQMVGAWSSNHKPMLTGEKLEYFKTYYRPVIPSVIILHAYWLNVFNDFDKTIQELRPMIYTYWG
jgi:hypothetical protein